MVVMLILFKDLLDDGDICRCNESYDIIYGTLQFGSVCWTYTFYSISMCMHTYTCNKEKNNFEHILF